MPYGAYFRARAPFVEQQDSASSLCDAALAGLLVAPPKLVALRSSQGQELFAHAGLPFVLLVSPSYHTTNGVERVNNEWDKSFSVEYNFARPKTH